MRVHRVLMPGLGEESWTLLGDDHVPVEPVERFLSYLASAEKSPNTVKAYAHDLKDWFTYLAGHRPRLADRPRWRTSPASWRGCGSRQRPVTGRSRCCPRWGITARRPA